MIRPARLEGTIVRTGPCRGLRCQQAQVSLAAVISVEPVVLKGEFLSTIDSLSRVAVGEHELVAVNGTKRSTGARLPSASPLPRMSALARDGRQAPHPPCPAGPASAAHVTIRPPGIPMTRGHYRLRFRTGGHNHARILRRNSQDRQKSLRSRFVALVKAANVHLVPRGGK